MMEKFEVVLLFYYIVLFYQVHDISGEIHRLEDGVQVPFCPIYLRGANKKCHLTINKPLTEPKIQSCPWWNSTISQSRMCAMHHPRWPSLRRIPLCLMRRVINGTSEGPVRPQRLWSSKFNFREMRKVSPRRRNMDARGGMEKGQEPPSYTEAMI